MKHKDILTEGLLHTLESVKEENKFAEEELGRYDDDLMAARTEIREYRWALTVLKNSTLSKNPAALRMVTELLDKYKEC